MCIRVCVSWEYFNWDANRGFPQLQQMRRKSKSKQEVQGKEREGRRIWFNSPSAGFSVVIKAATFGITHLEYVHEQLGWWPKFVLNATVRAYLVGGATSLPAKAFSCRSKTQRIFIFFWNSVYRQAISLPPSPSAWLCYLLAQCRGPQGNCISYVIESSSSSPYICFTQGILAWNEKIIG